MGLFDRLFGQKNEQSQEAAETVASNDLTDDISETESLDNQGLQNFDSEVEFLDHQDLSTSESASESQTEQVSQSENPEEALKYFYIVKDLGRNDNWLHMHLWINLEKTIGKEEALKYFQNEIKINDVNSSLWGSLGQIYMDVFSNYEEAEKAFKNAFKYSLNGQYLYDRSRALMGLKKYKEAIEVLLQSRKISEQEEELTDVEDIELVRCYIALKDRKNAEKYLKFAKEGIDNIHEEYIDEYKGTLAELENLINKL